MTIAAPNHRARHFTKCGDGSGITGSLFVAMPINLRRLIAPFCEKLGTPRKVPGSPGLTCSQSTGQLPFRPESPLKQEALGLPVDRMKFAGILHVRQIVGRRTRAIDIRIESRHRPYYTLIFEQSLKFFKRCRCACTGRPEMLRQRRLRQAHGFQNCNQLILHASFLIGVRGAHPRPASTRNASSSPTWNSTNP